MAWGGSWGLRSGEGGRNRTRSALRLFHRKRQRQQKQMTTIALTYNGYTEAHDLEKEKRRVKKLEHFNMKRQKRLQMKIKKYKNRLEQISQSSTAPGDVIKASEVEIQKPMSERREEQKGTDEPSKDLSLTMEKSSDGMNESGNRECQGDDEVGQQITGVSPASHLMESLEADYGIERNHGGEFLIPAEELQSQEEEDDKQH